MAMPKIPQGREVYVFQVRINQIRAKKSWVLRKWGVVPLEKLPMHMGGNIS
jgi:hypothetical protein